MFFILLNIEYYVLQANKGDSGVTLEEENSSEQSVEREAQPEVNKPANANKRVSIHL